MLKTILKKSFEDIAVSSMIILICFFFAAFFPHFMNYTPAQRLFFYDLLVRFVLGLSIIATLGVISYHFIMITDLFSIKKSVRRAISVLMFALLAFFGHLSVFSSFFSFLPTSYVLIGIAIIAILGATGTIVGFIIEDKVRRNDIDQINKRLNELKEEQ